MVLLGHWTQSVSTSWVTSTRGGSAKLGSQGNTFLGQAPGELSAPVLLSVEVICGKPE